MFTTLGCFSDLPNPLQQSMVQDRNTQQKPQNINDMQIFRSKSIAELNATNCIVLFDNHGRHLVSGELNPIGEQSSLNSTFLDLLPPRISKIKESWELSEICIAAHLGLKESKFAFCTMLREIVRIGLTSNQTSLIYVTDVRMLRVFRDLDWHPKVLSQIETAIGELCVIKWQLCQTALQTLDLRLNDQEFSDLNGGFAWSFNQSQLGGKKVQKGETKPNPTNFSAGISPTSTGS